LNKKLSLLVLLLVMVFTGCTRQIVGTKYYLLEYLPTTDNDRLSLQEPIPKRVLVRNFKIPRSYDSIRIIARFSSHQINYYRYSLWAVRPQIAIADLLVQHINAYHLFKSCQREMFEGRPEFEITGEIFQIERFESEQYSAAHIRMSIELYKYDNKERVVEHTFDREVPLHTESMTIFAKVVSDIVEDEVENFLVKMVDYFYPPDVDSLQVPE